MEYRCNLEKSKIFQLDKASIIEYFGMVHRLLLLQIFNTCPSITTAIGIELHPQ